MNIHVNIFKVLVIAITLFTSSCNSLTRNPSEVQILSTESVLKEPQKQTETYENLATASKTETIVLEPTSIEHFGVNPIQNKDILFEYVNVGDHFRFDYLFESHTVTKDYHLVLYKDGQMIITGDKFKQKILSKTEIERFLFELETMGFFSIETNHKDDPTDKLYNFGNDYHTVFDGTFRCVTVNYVKSRTLCAYEPHLDFLIPAMKNIFYYLDNYNPIGVEPYQPDRIILSINEGRENY
jgi:hypothetical protein